MHYRSPVHLVLVKQEVRPLGGAVHTVVEGKLISCIERDELIRLPIQFTQKAAVRALKKQPLALLPALAVVVVVTFVAEFDIFCHKAIVSGLSQDDEKARMLGNFYVSRQTIRILL